ncbi:MAG: hypothetical protein PHU23_12860 [Dehalococcoidales bacterium]|nr:hypothetical protein [Dehalococcoidales bacterium]
MTDKASEKLVITEKEANLIRFIREEVRHGRLEIIARHGQPVRVLRAIAGRDL